MRAWRFPASGACGHRRKAPTPLLLSSGTPAFLCATRYLCKRTRSASAPETGGFGASLTGLLVHRARNPALLVNSAGDGDFGLAEGVGDLRFAEARSVVFEGQLFSRIVEAKAAQAVSVGEFAEPAQLIVAQRGLQFVSNFHECHGGIISVAGEILMNRDVSQNHLI